MKKLSFSPDFFILLLAFCLCEGEIPVLCTLFSVFIHELSHAAMLIYFGAGVKSLRFTMFGGEMEPEFPLRLSKKWELAVLFAGPGSNLLAGLLFALAGDRLSVGYLLAGINLAHGMFNLLPVTGFDGGRVIMCLFPQSRFASGMLIFTSVILAAAGIAGGFYLCATGAFAPTPVLFGLWVFFYGLSSGRMLRKGSHSCIIGARKNKEGY